MKKVALYARCSSSKSDTSRQITELRQIAQNHEYEIVAEYVDNAVSGAIRNRVALNQMLEDAMLRKFEKILVLELSRLFRDTKHMLETAEFLESKNIDLFIVNQSIDTSTPANRFFFSVMSAVSQFERELIRERIMSGLDNARRKNKRLGRKSNLTELKKIQIVKKRTAENASIRQLCKEFKVSQKTIYEVLAASA